VRAHPKVQLSVQLTWLPDGSRNNGLTPTLPSWIQSLAFVYAIRLYLSSMPGYRSGQLILTWAAPLLLARAKTKFFLTGHIPLLPLIGVPLDRVQEEG